MKEIIHAGNHTLTIEKVGNRFNISINGFKIMFNGSENSKNKTVSAIALGNWDEYITNNCTRKKNS